MQIAGSVVWSVVLLVVVYVAMLVEAARSSRNERIQRARGGVEPIDDVYGPMRMAYPLSFLAMVVEGALRGAPPAGVIAAGALTFGLAKAIKWWAIVSLGSSWTFRVIVVPGAPLVASGPYRFLRHPNYVGVIGELVGVALLSGAMIAGVIATLTFAVILRRRIAVEEHALGIER